MKSEISSTFSLILLLLLLIISAIFTAFEAAIYNTLTSKLRRKAKYNRTISKVIELKKHPEKLISTVVIGNNLANIFFTSLITFVTVEYTNKYVLSGGTQVLIASIIATIIIVVFGETIPKNIGSYFPETTSIFLYNILNVFSKILYPLTWLLTKISWLILRLFKIDNKEKKTFEVQEDVLSMIELGKEEGIIEKNEEKMIYSIFEFGDTLVREVMRPRVDIVAIDDEANEETIIKIITESGHSRIPVYHENIDQVIGILYIKDFIRIKLQSGKIERINDLLRPAYFVPETKRVDELFSEMQKNKIQLAMVFDEYGGISGLVTLEDILEEIVGEIQDEYDKESKEIQKIAENAYLVSGTLSVEEFNEKFKSNFSDEEASTVGGLILEKLGRLPNPGEEIRFDNLRLIISKIRERRIIQVKVITKGSEENNE